MNCSFNGCGFEVVAHGLCRGHVTQKYRKQELKPLRKKASDVEEETLKPSDVTALWKARLSRGKASQ